MKKIIERYNDLLSGKYDEATLGEFKWSPPPVLKRYIKPYIKQGGLVLDVGVGTGQTASIFLEKGLSVTGIDISQNMIDISRSKYASLRLIKIDAEKGLLKYFSHESFDIIVAVGILEFVKDIKKTLNEMKRLLKKNGVIAFTFEVFDPHSDSKKTAYLGHGIEPIPPLLKFKVYRRSPLEIETTLKKLSLRVLVRKEFTGYVKTANKIPVPYGFYIVKKAR